MRSVLLAVFSAIVATPFAAHALSPLYVGAIIQLELVEDSDETAHRVLYTRPEILGSSNTEFPNIAAAFRAALTSTAALAPPSPWRWMGRFLRRRPPTAAEPRRILAMKIRHKESQRVIGFTSFTETWIADYWETSTAIDPEFQNHGVGFEARAAARDFMFRRYGAAGLISSSSARNARSRRLTEKLGFRLLRPVTRRNAIDGRISFFEYRLSRETYLGTAPPVSSSIRAATFSELKAIDLTPTTPTKVRITSFYRLLMADPGIRARLSPEEISVLAEELELGPRPGVTSDSEDRVLLRLFLKEIETDFRALLEARFSGALVNLELRFASRSYREPEEILCDLVATFDDGSEHTADHLRFFVEGERTATQWSMQRESWRAQFGERLQLPQQPADPERELEQLQSVCTGVFLR